MCLRSGVLLHIFREVATLRIPNAWCCPMCSCCSAYWLLVSLVVLLLLYRHVRARYALWLLMPPHVPTVFYHMYCNMCTSSTPDHLISGMLVDNDISLYLWGVGDACYYMCTGGVIIQ